MNKAYDDNVTYLALDIAKYIINKCINLRRPISNLQLQKIMYYVQVSYIKREGELLFPDRIEAWQYGPAIPSVYYEYINYSSSDIRDKQEEIEITESIKHIIDPVIDSKSLLSAWELTNDTKNDPIWKIAYMSNTKNIINEILLRKLS